MGAGRGLPADAHLAAGLSWRRRLSISVNLSARQLQDQLLAGRRAGARQQSGLDPSGLQLEITESVVMHEPEATVVKLHALKQLGLKLAVDDFGTGYFVAGLSKRFPIDVLKIDRAFVTGLGAGRTRLGDRPDGR